MSRTLRAVAQETLEITRTGMYTTRGGPEVSIGGDIAAAVSGTVLHAPGERLTSPAAGPDAEGAAPVIEVTNETTLAAARRLDAGAACLVFASAKNPGGGFRTGASAQEEDIARASALVDCLVSVPEYYEFHRRQRDLRYSDRVIYSPRVPVFRDDRDDLLEVPYLTSFLTAAAPNLGAIASNQPADAPSVPDVLAARAGRVLDVAAAHGHRTLVLGAWGCGVFRNDPAVVAASFARHLGRTRGRFDRVVFAVYDRRAGTPAVRAFQEAFS
jgi:uncharacterized protein (TIGR02452 family)